MLETLDYSIRIGSTPTFLNLDLYLYSANAAHYVYNQNIDVLLSPTESKHSVIEIEIEMQNIRSCLIV